MRTLGRFFGKLWAFYAVVAFGIIALIYLPTLALIIRFSEKNRFRNGHAFVCFWAKSLLVAFGMPWRSFGTEKVPRDRPVIVVCNHVSMVDILVCLATIPVPFRFLSKKEAGKMPAVGYCVRNLYLLVDRKSKESRAESMRLMVGTLTEGIGLMIYPEGTRNRGPAVLKDFYDGAFRVAVDTGAPLQVVTLPDDWKRQNPHMGFSLKPGRVRAIYDEPIFTEGLGDKDVAQLKEQVANMMRSHLEQAYPHGLPVF